MNLFSLLQNRFPSDLSQPFIERIDGKTVTYRDVLDWSGRLANLFVEMGIRPGDRIAVQTDKSAETLLVYLASLRAGAVYLPLNPAYTPAEVRYFLTDSTPALFVCRPANEDAARRMASELRIPYVETLGVQGDGSLLDAGRAENPAFSDIERGDADLAAILYTSGTTGRSKGAMLTHANLASNSETLRRIWRFTREDRLLHALPIFHTHGLFVATNIMLMAGGSMILLPAFDTDQVLAALPRSTVMMGVPTFYTRLLARPELTRDLVAQMRLFVSGSAPLSAETHREFEKRTGHAILERYGMTETSMNTSNPYDGDRIPGSVGLPLPGVEIRITDLKSGLAVKAGEVGSIEIRGPNVFAGYWQMPEKTKSEFRDDNFFVSGDLGFADARGYIYISGREKDLIISGGLNVYPAEVESIIEALPGVAECAVIGVGHPDFGEGVVAVIVPRPGATPTEDSLKQALSEQLANYKLPKRIFVAAELPRNAMGKIQKVELRRRYADIFGADRENGDRPA